VYAGRLQRLKEQTGFREETTAALERNISPDELRSRKLQTENEIVIKDKKLSQLEDALVGAKDDEQKTYREQLEQLTNEVDKLRLELSHGELSLENIARRTDEWEKSQKRQREEREQREKKHKELESQMSETAKHEADLLVPLSLTVAGMGITGSFFIELTAILTIIFGILILGIIGVLRTTEIAPILAAIAGYVLGKTTSGWAPYGGAVGSQQPISPQSISNMSTSQMSPQGQSTTASSSVSNDGSGRS
jgi:hypothetical protein